MIRTLGFISIHIHKDRSTAFIDPLLKVDPPLTPPDNTLCLLKMTECHYSIFFQSAFVSLCFNLQPVQWDIMDVWLQSQMSIQCRPFYSKLDTCFAETERYFNLLPSTATCLLTSARYICGSHACGNWLSTMKDLLTLKPRCLCNVCFRVLSGN